MDLRERKKKKIVFSVFIKAFRETIQWNLSVQFFFCFQFYCSFYSTVSVWSFIQLETKKEEEEEEQSYLLFILFAQKSNKMKSSISQIFVLK